MAIRSMGRFALVNNINGLASQDSFSTNTSAKIHSSVVRGEKNDASHASSHDGHAPPHDARAYQRRFSRQRSAPPRAHEHSNASLQRGFFSPSPLGQI